MTTADAIRVIKALFQMLDKKSAMPLPNSIKMKLAKAKHVLKESGEYAISDNGMYGTITESRGLYTTACYPIKEDSATGTGSIEELFNEQLKALATPATDSKADELSLDNV